MIHHCKMGVLLMGLVATTLAAQNKFEVTQGEKQVDVKLNGELLTTYHTTVGAKPILWPILGTPWN